MKIGLITGIIILLLLAAGGVWYLYSGAYFKSSGPGQASAPSGVASSGSAGSGANANSNEVSGTKEVLIRNFVFSPRTLTIKAGDSVKWTNQDSAKHTITSDSGNELDSSLFGKGESFTHTFDKAGTYTYHCTPHPNMKGTIIVE